MKKNLKQALVPLAVMVFGAAAAFATNAAKQSQRQSTVEGLTGCTGSLTRIGD
jgi:hypothetical protein